MKLSGRLETVVSFVEKGSRIADVGTDHGYVPIVLAKRGLVDSGVAMDVREGPLKRAREHIRQYGLDGVIKVRLSDGVKELGDGEADTVIVAGMGGELVIHILEDGRRLWGQVKHWILSPQSEIYKVRKFLGENGFFIGREEMVEEDGKYYTVMDAAPGAMGRMEPWEMMYGPCLVRQGHPVLREFLVKERTALEMIIEGLKGQEGEGARRRGEELKEQMVWVEKALEGSGEAGREPGQTARENHRQKEQDCRERG